MHVDVVIIASLVTGVGAVLGGIGTVVAVILSHKYRLKRLAIVDALVQYSVTHPSAHEYVLKMSEQLLQERNRTAGGTVEAIKDRLRLPKRTTKKAMESAADQEQRPLAAA